MFALPAIGSFFKAIPKEIWIFIVAIVAAKTYGELKEREGEQRANQRIAIAKERANARARETLQTIKEDTHDRVERTREAVASIPADSTTADRLSDSARSRYIRD